MANNSGFQFNFLDGSILTEQQLLDTYHKLYKEYSEPLSIIEWQDKGATSRAELLSSLEERMMNIRYVLKSKWPQKYGQIVRNSKVIRL